jgi:nicotinate-nucleotide adenylyltransferase
MCKQFPDVDFIWLMGEDNWLCFDQWYRWQDIMQLVPVAIFHREIEASWESCSASEVFAGARVVDFSQLVNCKTPAWSYLPIEAHAMSSTKIRKG